MKSFTVFRRCKNYLAPHAVGLGRSLLRGFTSLVYPPFCMICGDELAGRERIICTRCWSSFECIDQPLCRVCGAPLKRVDQNCLGCSTKTFSFAGARAAYVYSENVRKALHAFKFHRKLSLAQRFARGMAFTVLNDTRFREADYLIPVPLHLSRLRERGYNQSDLLAEGIAAELGIPCLKDALVRKKRTKTMSALDPERRLRNVERAFAVVERSTLEGQRIALVDDVFTTGATVDACARVLREAGVAEVNVLTAVRALAHPS